MNDKQIKDFMKDLTKITKKHGIAVGGCGCCGSPFLVEVNKKGNYDHYGQCDLSWEEENE